MTRVADGRARRRPARPPRPAGELAAERPGVSRVHAQRVEHVAEVEPGGLDLRSRPGRGPAPCVRPGPTRGCRGRRAARCPGAGRGRRRGTAGAPPGSSAARDGDAARRATCCSSSAASSSATSSSAASAPAGSRSTSVARSSGRSSATTRPSPHSGDWASARSPPRSLTGWAPRVTSHSRGAGLDTSSACTSASRRPSRPAPSAGRSPRCRGIEGAGDRRRRSTRLPAAEARRAPSRAG